MNTRTLKGAKGITLVALIITIIVLLILAMVSIALVMNSGIIDKSKTAVDKYSQEEIQEQIKLAYSEWQMGQYSGVTEDAPTFVKNKLNSIYGAGTVTNVTAENGVLTVELANGKTYTYNVATGVASKVKTVAEYPEATPGQANNDENTKYTSDNKTAVIPKGYTLDATQNSIDNGLVISKDGNEWVWIPVNNADFIAMFGTANDDGWTMSGTGTNGIEAVITKYKTTGTQSRGNPGTTDYREPDVLNSGSYDKNATNLSNARLGSNIGEAATKLRDDYKAMIDSVKKNGGFYVGRYELSSAGTKKKQASLTSTNWYNLYKACKNIDNAGVETRMIWGCQWDKVCNFIHTSGDQVNLTNSASYGNCKDSTVDGHGSKRVTGYSDIWKANNIYDIAGNCFEWTQEAGYAGDRAVRGGYYYHNGDRYPVTYRSSYYPTYADSFISSRPTLYIK